MAVRSDPDRLQIFLLSPLPLGAVGAASVLALHYRDPHSPGSWGHCPFLTWTGLPCPGCGGLRAVNDLTNGNVVGALASNTMAVVLVGTVSVLWLAWLIQRLRGRSGPALNSRWATVLFVGLGAAFVLFGVYRMTPWGAWLRP